jgi:hypothetical protein
MLTGQQPTLPVPYPLPFGSSLSYQVRLIAHNKNQIKPSLLKDPYYGYSARLDISPIWLV